MSIRDWNGHIPDTEVAEDEVDPDTTARQAIAANLLRLTEVLDAAARDALDRMDAILAHLDKK